MDWLEQFFSNFSKLSLVYKLEIIFLLLLISSLAIAYLLPAVVPMRKVHNSKIQGLIIRDQVWSGTIEIVGDTITLPGTTITIEPGTKILISKNGDKSNFDFIPWHLKHGINTVSDQYGVLKGDPFWDELEKVQLRIFNIRAWGTKELPIIITSNDSGGSRFDINVIWISKGEITNIKASNYRRLEIGDKVAVRDSQFENNDECALCVKIGKPQIIGSSFRLGYKTYISVYKASPVIKNNTFWESKGDGIVYLADYSVINITENFFQIPSKAVVKARYANQEGVMARNFFSSGDIYLPCNSRTKLIHNYIKGKVIFDSQINCQGEYILAQNYWDIKDRDAVLKARIVGVTDKFKINMPFILISPPAQVPVEN